MEYQGDVRAQCCMSLMSTLTPLVLQIASVSGRRKVVKLFINLTRWVHTVHAMNLLPPPPPAPLADTFSRPSPYPGESNACPSSNSPIEFLYQTASVNVKDVAARELKHQQTVT